MRIRPWVLAALGLIAFGLLVWFAGPLVSIGHDAPLTSDKTRIALIGAFVLQYLAQKGWSAWHARRRNERVVEALAPAAAAAEPAESAQLRKRFAAALKTLRHARFGARGGFWSSLSWKFGRQYLYQLPWYVIIGAPGAGKTTALLNSGLQFPLAGDLGRGSIKGVGGTRNCDWWFTDAAVLLDTAGRYTTHEADRIADRQAWKSFLALLASSRPRQPLNGVLVALSVTDLLGFDAVQRAQHAATLRARLDEIRHAIGMRLPVYLLLTKCDLLPGFLDSFVALDRLARDQVWGTTFDLDASYKGKAVDQFPSAFEQLVARLYEGLVERMQGERDAQRRARIFTFPRQFAGLQEPLSDVLRQTFGAGSSDLREAPACLRGVYFTSGTQEGTPIDRALSALGRELGLQRQILPPNQSTGKSFFLSCVLREVIFAESEIAARSPKLQRWRVGAMTGLLALVVCVGAALAAYWLTGYSRSSRQIDQIARSVQAARTRIAASDLRPGSDPRPLLPALDALQELAVSISPTSATNASPLWALDLHQHLKLAAAARQAYQRMLLDLLLVRVVERTEEQMRSGADPNLQYEALKAYTMIHDAVHFDAASLKAFVTYDWDTALQPPLESKERAELVRHLEALLDAGAAGAVTAADSRLVESVRARLAGQALSQRIATRLKAVIGSRPYPDVTVASFGEAAQALFAGRDGHSAPRGVPGSFTLAAYRDGVLTALPTVASQLATEANWVLATPASPAATGPDTAKAAGAQALAIYLNEYAQHWADFVDDLRLKGPSGTAEAIVQAQELSARDGPLVALLQAVVDQTTLHDAALAPAAGAAAASPERLVQERFAALHESMRAGADGRRLLDTALADFKELHALRALAGSDAGNPASDAAAIEFKRLEHIRGDARRFPEPIQPMLLELASLPAPAQTKSVTTPKPTPAPPSAQQTDAKLAVACEQLVPGRFPFNRGSQQEISLANFNRLFAPSGLFDSASASASGRDADERAGTALNQAGAEDKMLARFRSAERIREVFFAGKRAQVALRLTFRPHDMDETIDRFLLEVDGQQVGYAHGPPTATVVTWPGPRPGVRVEMTPAAEGQPALQFDGTWALFRLLDRVPVESIAPGRFRIVFNLGGRRASFDVETEGGANPFRMPELERFDCPSHS